MRTKEKTKKINLNRTTTVGKSKVNGEKEEIILPKKIIDRPIEIEETEVLIETEKPVDETVVEDGEVEEADEAGLNEEDLDPFGDKWEQ